MPSCCGPNGPATRPTTRRQFLQRAGGGFGMLALASLLEQQGLLAGETKEPHFAARAKRVIFLFMSGGPSHLETFDPKPELQRLHGQKLPASFGHIKTRRGVDRNLLLGTKRTFTKHGQSGIEVSDWLPNLATCVDDLCVLRGCYGDSVTHPESVYLMNCGSILMGRPCLGSWVAYGLGTENQNMPAFVVLPDPAGWVKGGAPAWGNGFLPATYQGTILRGGASPILNLTTPKGVSADQQQATVELINKLNRQGARGGDDYSELAARTAAYELAFRMQAHAPDVVDIRKETDATKALYGLDNKPTAEFGLRCLFARRMVERGV